jgi:hypothetical protein
MPTPLKKSLEPSGVTGLDKSRLRAVSRSTEYKKLCWEVHGRFQEGTLYLTRDRCIIP